MIEVTQAASLHGVLSMMDVVIHSLSTRCAATTEHRRAAIRSSRNEIISTMSRRGCCVLHQQDSLPRCEMHDNALCHQIFTSCIYFSAICVALYAACKPVLDNRSMSLKQQKIFYGNRICPKNKKQPHLQLIQFRNIPEIYLLKMKKNQICTFYLPRQYRHKLGEVGNKSIIPHQFTIISTISTET